MIKNYSTTILNGDINTLILDDNSDIINNIQCFYYGTGSLSNYNYISINTYSGAVSNNTITGIFPLNTWELDNIGINNMNNTGVGDRITIDNSTDDIVICNVQYSKSNTPFELVQDYGLAIYYFLFVMILIFFPFFLLKKFFKPIKLKQNFNTNIEKKGDK